MPRRVPFVTSIAALAMALSLAGCSASADVDAGSGTTAAVAATSADTRTDINQDTHFDDDDLSWDHDGETAISLKDGGSTSSSDGAAVEGDTINITQAGDYRITGSLADGGITVNAPDDAVVRLVLDGAELANGSGSPLSVTSANEVLVYLEEGTTNTLSDASTYTDTSEDAANATISSRADLTIAGPGALDVIGNYNDAINVSDGLVIAGGTITATAVDDGIRGKDYVAMAGGTVEVTAEDDGVKADNDEDEGRGWLLVQDGRLTVDAGDDGVKAYNKLAVTGGSATVTRSAEGLEAAHLDISGGTVTITSSDDGLNAASGQTGGTADAAIDAPAAGGMPAGGAAPEGGEMPERPSDGEQPADMPEGGPGGGGGGETVSDNTLVISGGTVTVTADGDGLDSNGTATITGGTTVINGPTGNGNGPLDVNGDLTVNGGTLAAAGSSGMSVTPADSSTQSGIQAVFDEPLEAGTTIQIADKAGTVVQAFTTTRETASLVYSRAGITDGDTYVLSTGGSASTDEGLGEGSATGAEELMTVTAGEYTGGGMGGSRGGSGS